MILKKIERRKQKNQTDNENAFIKCKQRQQHWWASGLYICQNYQHVFTSRRKLLHLNNLCWQCCRSLFESIFIIGNISALALSDNSYLRGTSISISSHFEIKILKKKDVFRLPTKFNSCNCIQKLSLFVMVLHSHFASNCL
jgi:hypothetical protein